MFPWHSMRDKAKTVHSYQFIHLLLTHRIPVKTPVDSSLFWRDLQNTGLLQSQKEWEFK